MPGFDKLLRGLMKYRKELRPQVLEQFQHIKDNPEPKAVMFSCVDSRILITRLLHTDPGDMFLVRNAGNLVPHSTLFDFDSVSTEPGVLELGCITNKINHVAVCGHSDCKAMNGLFGLLDSVHLESGTPLQKWLRRHGHATVLKWKLLQQLGGVGPISFQGESIRKTFSAYIDEENRFQDVDKFSQVNTLQQLQNIASYEMLQDKLESGNLHLHALWFDVYRGDFYMFSRQKERFLIVDEDTEALFQEEIEKRCV